MSAFEDQAASFFPSMASAAAPAAAPAAQPVETDEQRQARSLYGETSPKAGAPAKPRDEPADEIEKAERFFAESPIFEDPKRAIENAALENLETPEVAREIAAQYEPWMQEFQLNSSEASELTQLGVSATMSPPNDEALANWSEASRAGLRQDFGPRAGEALQAARQLIKSNPKLAQFLDETGLGNHPSYVRLAASKAMELRRRGKL